MKPHELERYLKEGEDFVEIGHTTGEEEILGITEKIFRRLKSIKEENSRINLKIYKFEDPTEYVSIDEEIETGGCAWDVYLVAKLEDLKNNQELVKKFKDVFNEERTKMN